MNTLLVLSSGQTDVQLVVDGKRRELNKKKYGELHDLIEQHIGEYELVDAPVSKGDEAEALPDGGFQLCTPKLDAALQHLNDRPTASIKALILETQRKHWREDPRFAGAVLERRLREKGVTNVSRCPYLRKDDGDFADISNPKDAIIRRDIVSRIDEAIRKSMSGSIDKVVVASTGGPPAITSLIDEVARLHAGTATCELMEIEDGARKTPPTTDTAISRSTWEPQESFRARRHALELINKGNLLAAWGAVHHFHDDEVERQWTQVIKWLADFAASLPIPDECDIDLLKHDKMAVRAAVRVELALRAGDIPRAVHGTIAFFESALWDHLELHLKPNADPKKSRLFRVEPEPENKLVRQGIAESASDDRKRPFEFVEVGGVRWYKVFDDDICAIQLAKYYLHNDQLMKLGQAVSKVRDLRNDVAHNEPTPRLMSDARRQMEDAGLWKDDRFLTQPFVSAVLTELGVVRPTELCEDLIKTVRDRLLNPIPDPKDIPRSNH